MIGCLSALSGSFTRNEKRPPPARQRRIEGLTTRRSDLPMAAINPMYPSSSATADSLPVRSNDG
jgi:hypothetical protein